MRIFQTIIIAAAFLWTESRPAFAFRIYDDSVMSGYTKGQYEGFVPAGEKEKENAQLLGKASAAELKGNYAEALESLVQVTRNEPKNKDLYCRLAYDFVKVKDFRQAESALRQARELGRKDLWILKALGFVYFNQLKAGEAVAVLEEATAQAPADRWIHMQLGSAYDLLADIRKKEKDYDPQADYEKALDHTKKAVAMGGDAALYSQAGKIYGALGQFWEALDYLHRAESAGRADAWLYSEMGWDYGMVEDYREALAYFRNAEKAGRKDAWIYSKIAWSHDRLGETEQAIGEYKRALALSPGDPWSNYNLGVALRNHKDYEEAVALYLEMTRKGEYPGWTQLQLARIYALLGMEEGARDYLQQGKKLLDTTAADVSAEIEQIELLLNTPQK
ncbi:MAG: tetratricopeptide repeat protein [Fusobacteriaceae bacterium]|jgi:tetratricopeptide (TPR) repeat protein|nr:tetratricopeptide repeat protein [Fusobacteriaceae bacterium]